MLISETYFNVKSYYQRFKQISFWTIQNYDVIFIQLFNCFEHVLLTLLNKLLRLLMTTFSPSHSEIQTLKRSVSSPPLATLDLGSQNTSNPSCFSSTDALSVVCCQYEYVMSQLMLMYTLDMQW